MTDKQFMYCVKETGNYTDRDAYISDLCLSSIWEGDEGEDIPQERVDVIGSIWDACHRSMKDIASEAGLSQRKLAERFCIPYRTMENWCGGQNECPVYVRLMMQECIGILKR